MSVIFSTATCCFIDHEHFLEGIYSSCKVVEQNKDEIGGSAVCPKRMKLKFNPNSFAIHLPFLMDSQVHKFKYDMPITDKPTSKKKKRKYHHVNPMVEYHEQIKDVLISALKELQEIGSQKGLFHPPSLELMATNNREARNVAIKIQKQAEKFAEIFNCENSHPFDVTEISFSDSLMMNRVNESLVNYTSEEPCFVSIANNKFVMPAKSSFFMSQLEHLPQLVTLGKSYNLIVLDPPWFNKSVKRKKGYFTLSKSDILEIPVEYLSKQDCIVAVWVTNSQSLLTFVQEELFPSWKLKFCAIWHWVKVTKSGKLTCDLDSQHKKPYEHIIIGCKCEESTKFDFQNHKVVFSVPSSIHSHKPPLHDILRPYMKDNSENLELFARYLLPGWTSWGNEVKCSRVLWEDDNMHAITLEYWILKPCQNFELFQVLLLQHVDNYECQYLL